jgi:hypothetical protein
VVRDEPAAEVGAGKGRMSGVAKFPKAAAKTGGELGTVMH